MIGGLSILSGSTLKDNDAIDRVLWAMSDRPTAFNK